MFLHIICDVLNLCKALAKGKPTTKTSQRKVQILQCLLHMPQLLPKFRTVAVLFAVSKTYSTWGRCSKHCNTMSGAMIFLHDGEWLPSDQDRKVKLMTNLG